MTCIDEEAASTASNRVEQEENSNTTTATDHESFSPPLVEMSLENVTYSPMTSTASETKRRKVILNNISTSIKPNELTAWMGPSGSGKTSLISVAAGLVSGSDLSPDTKIRINGTVGSLPKRLVGVVWQDDLLLSNLTVEETITFAARLKSPLPDVKELVESTMVELGIDHVRNSLVGGGRVRGISGGERKRVSVASELVVRPSLLLLDEPTSGLDASSAQSLMSTLKNLALAGHAVTVVVHQPRTTIFELIDHLLLLSKGQTVYNGRASCARIFLEECPSVMKLPPETGIADWLLDVITHDEQFESTVLAKHWQEKGESATNCNENTARSPLAFQKQLSSLTELEAIPKFDVPFWTQLSLLTKRSLKQQRGEKLTRVGILLTLTYTLFTGIFWFRLPDNTNYIFDRNSVIFFMLIAQANGIVTSSMTIFQQERALLKRERAKKLYGVLPYFLAKTASDMTNNVLLPTLYCAITYWIVNLRSEAAAFFRFLVAMYLTLSTAQSMGLFLSIAIPNMQIALMLAPPITLFFIILGGFYIPYDNLNNAIRWASWLSFARYGYSSMLVNEYSGREIECATDGDPSIAIGISEKCPLPGDYVVDSLGIYGISTEFWFNVGIVAVLQIVFRVASYVLLRRSK